MAFAGDGGGFNFGALGTAKTESAGGNIAVYRKIGGGMAAFGEYDYRDIKAETDGGGYLRGIQNAKADGGTAGLEFSGIFAPGDTVRVSAKQEAQISGGEMLVRYPQALGDITKALHGEAQRVEAKELRIPLAKKRATVWTLGYLREFDDGAKQWSAAAEYDAKNKRGALSAYLRVQF